MPALATFVETELKGADARRVRAMLERAFPGDFHDDDWDHALGGHHAVVWVDGAVAAHAALVPRRLWIGDREVRAGYLEAVGVPPELRKRGHGTRALRALLPTLLTYELGALSTDAHGFYEELGWMRWQGPTWVLGGGRRRRTPDEDGGIMVLPTPTTGALDLRQSITCEERAGDDW